MYSMTSPLDVFTPMLIFLALIDPAQGAFISQMLRLIFESFLQDVLENWCGLSTSPAGCHYAEGYQQHARRRPKHGSSHEIDGSRKNFQVRIVARVASPNKIDKLLQSFSMQIYPILTKDSLFPQVDG